MLNYAELAEFNYVELIYYKVGQVLRSGDISYKAEQYEALYFKNWQFNCSQMYLYNDNFIVTYL